VERQDFDTDRSFYCYSYVPQPTAFIKEDRPSGVGGEGQKERR
jgi:hypothetical protein